MEKVLKFKCHFSFFRVLNANFRAVSLFRVEPVKIKKDREVCENFGPGDYEVTAAGTFL